jgi:hypothetical protein
MAVVLVASSETHRQSLHVRATTATTRIPHARRTAQGSKGVVPLDCDLVQYTTTVRMAVGICYCIYNVHPTFAPVPSSVLKVSEVVSARAVIWN